MGNLTLPTPIPLYSPKTEPKIDLYGSPSPSSDLSPETVTNRVEKAAYATQGMPISMENLQNAFQNGNDAFVREYAANQEALDLRRARDRLLQDFLQNKEGVVTQEEAETIMNIGSPEFEQHLASVPDPNSILEFLLARKLVEQTHSIDEHSPGSAINDLDPPDPEDGMPVEDYLDLLDVSEFNIAKSQIAATKLESLQATADKRGLGSKIWDFVEQNIPGVWEYQTHNVVDMETPPTTILPGNNWEQQAVYLNNLKPKDFYYAFSSAVDEIAGSNIDTALMFASYVIQHSVADTSMQNLYGVLDAADIASSVLGVTIKGGKAIGRGLRVRRRLADVVKAGSEPKLDVANVVAATGETLQAGGIQAVANVRRKIIESDPNYRGTNLWNTVVTMMNPIAITRRSINFSGEATRRIEEYVVHSSNILQQAILNPSFVSRVSRQADAEMVQAAIETTRKEFTHVNDSVLDIRDVTPEKNNLGNIKTVEVVLGKPDGSYFASRSKAEASAKRYKLPTGGYNIQPAPGGKHYIQVLRDVDETHGMSITLDTEEKAPENLISAFIGSVRTPEDLVSKLSRDNRHAATHSTQEFRRYVNEVAESVGKLKKAERNKLEGFLNANRDFKEIKIDPKTSEAYWDIGRAFNKLSEFETAYLDYAGHFPSEQSAVAYFHFRLLQDFDYVIRNLGMYRDLARQGIADNQVRINGTLTDWFRAKEVDSLPLIEDRGDEAIAMIDNETGKATIIHRQSKTSDDISVMNKRLKSEGYKILQVENPVSRPLKPHGVNEPVFWIVAKDTTYKPLDYKVLDYNPGGHVGYSQEAMLKQAVVTKHSRSVNIPDDYVTLHRGSSTLDNTNRPRFFSSNESVAKGYASDTSSSQKKALKDNSIKPVLETINVKFKNLLKVPKGGLNSGKYAEMFPEYAKTLGRKMDQNDFIEAAKQAGYDGIDFQNTDYVVFPDAEKFKGNRFHSNYEGDRTAFAFTTTAEAEKYAPLINHAMTLLKKPKELTAYLKKNIPALEAKDFLRMFTRRRVNGTVLEPRFDPTEPFIALMKNQDVESALAGTDRALDKRHANFTSISNSRYNLSKNVNKEFSGPRDLDLLTMKETPNGLGITSAKKIDSYQMMSKAMGSLTNERFFKDYQIQAAVSWLKQFGNALSEEGQRLAKQSPLSVIFDPKYDKSIAKGLLRSHAENNRRAVVAFLGQQTEFDKRLHLTMHKLLSTVYNNFGQKGSEFASGMLIAKLDDPFRYFRAFAFHLKLGLFNPLQIWAQGQTLAYSLAIAGPQHAIRSLSAAMLMRAAKFNPRHLEAIAGKAEKFGWKREEFTDMFEHMMNSGWGNVEGEIGYLDDIQNPSLWKSAGGQWLDKGKVFFNGTERINRLNAWALAYIEHKKRFPKTSIGDRERNAILTRADDLAMNMTRASNTALQRGVFSLPLQFFTYQQRMMEQMLGKRLTRAEKARVFAMFSALYGVPVAVSGVGGVMGGVAGAFSGAIAGGDTTFGEGVSRAGKGVLGGGWNFYDDLRQSALEKGVDVDNGMMEVFMEGLVTTGLEAMFGNEYNGGDRYGPSGIQLLSEVTGEDKSVAELAFGVSGSVVGDIVRATQPVLMGLTDIFSEEQGKYPLSLSDFTDLPKNISTINNFTQMFYMMNTGRYVSKNGLQILDTDMQDAVMRGFFGLSPRHVPDTFLMLGNNAERRKMQKEAADRIGKNIRRGLEAQNKEDRDMYFRKAKAEQVAAGFLPTQYGDLLQNALKDGNETLYNKVHTEFYLNQGSPEDLRARQQLLMDQGK